MSKSVKVSVGIVLGLGIAFYLLIYLYGDRYNDYSRAVDSYEENDLQSAYRLFKRADGLFNSEKYMKEIEEIMYAYLKEHENDENYKPEFDWYQIELEEVPRFAEEAKIWGKKYDDYLEDRHKTELDRYESSPPYEGMSANYIYQTLWGEPHVVDRHPIHDDLITYYWYGDGREVKVVTVSDGKVIKVNDWSE
ncbi:hypothetical protein ACQKII_14085 [Lysinibacillus sp. NPDC048646]|uniref:hypothetical protein n=1 Tax=Lysinibacillus sp. NPDC048646 TaxID=3390574 RepID=UPI003D049658